MVKNKNKDKQVQKRPNSSTQIRPEKWKTAALIKTKQHWEQTGDLQI